MASRKSSFPQMMCSEDDLKELSIPMGPRKKIIAYQKDYIKEKVKTAYFSSLVSDKRRMLEIAVSSSFI